jgi:hypothetical protein
MKITFTFAPLTKKMDGQEISLLPLKPKKAGGCFPGRLLTLKNQTHEIK